MTEEKRPLIMNWLNSAKDALFLKNTTIKKWVKGLCLTLITLAILGFAFAQIGVRYWLWPTLPAHKQQIEKLLSDRLKVKVSIGKIETSWSKFSPEFNIEEIRFSDPQENTTKPLLAIPKISGAIRWSSIWHLQPLFTELTSSGITLQAKRDTQGQWWVAGVAIKPKSGDSAALNWLLSNNQLKLSEIKIDVLDEFEKTNALQINIAEFQAANEDHHHILKAKLSSDLTQGKLELNSEFDHTWFSKKTNWRNWQGNFNWSATDLQLANIFHLSKLPAKVTSGQIFGSGNLTIQDGGKLHGSGAVTASNVDVFWNNNQTSLKLRSLALDYSQSTEDSLQFITAKKLQWALKSDKVDASPKELKNIRFGLVLPKPGKPIDTIAIGANEINLSEFKTLSSQLPIPNKFLKQLNELNPQGNIRQLEVFWHYLKPAPNEIHILEHTPEFKVKATLDKLGWESSSLNLPATHGLSAVVEASEKSGRIEFTSQDFQSNLGNYLNSEQVNFDKLLGTVTWEKNDKHTNISAKDLQLSNKEVNLKINANYLKSNDGSPSKLDLNLKIPEAKLNRVPYYLPAKLSKKVRDYLTGTLVDGDIKDAELTIKGDPKLIPYYDRRAGTFELSIPISNGKYRPLARKPTATKDWPAFENVNANIAMKHGDIRITIPSANYQSVLINNLAVDIDVAKKPSTLAIKGNASGQLNDFIQYAIESPVLAKSESLLKPLNATGDAKLAIEVNHEFSSTKPTSFLADIQLAKNTVAYNKNVIAEFSESQIALSENGISTANFQGNLLGGPLSIQKSKDSNAPVDIKGNLKINKLLVLSPNKSEALVELQKRITGQLNYQGTITQINDQRRTHIDLDFSGMNANLPEPLYKKSGHALTGTIDYLKQKDSQSSRSSWQFKLGSKFGIKGNSTNGESAQIISYGLNNPIPPNKGTLIAFDLDNLDVDTWRSIFPGNDSKKSDGSPTWGFTQINGKVKQLKTSGRVINDLNIQATHENEVWEATINSPLVAGLLKWKNAGIGLPSGELTARLSRLSIPDEESKTSLTTSLKKSTTKIPKLDITINDFTLGTRKLGSVDIKATSEENAWSLDSLTIKHPSASLIAKGLWELPDGASAGKTSMNIEISSKDSGDFMSALGYPKALENGEGKLTGNVSWEGAPYSFNKKTLNGDLTLEVTRGKLLQVDPGAAKLLGILSFQSLFKLATLNLEGGYGEAFSKGTFFDKITGNAKISNGIARSQNLELISGLADVLTRGRVDLNEETQDLRITITPKLNLGTASVAAYYFINPFIGLSTLVGQYLISTGVNKIYKSDYLIQGSWKSPEVIALDQKGQPIDSEKLNTIRRKGLLQEPRSNQEKGNSTSPTLNQE